MDEIKRNNLLSEYANVEAPIIPIRRFFDGNDDEGSIGCNLTEHPGIERFKQILEGLLSRSDVTAVYARIAELETGGYWPFTDTIAVTGSISVDDLRAALTELQPDEVGAAADFGFVEAELPDLAGTLAAWWD
jgi:hypothetical protein